MPNPRAALGAWAEQLAARFLQRRGYRIVARQFRTPQGEIDLVSYDDQTLCFVEVRARAHARVVHPALSITSQKQTRIVRAARAYLSQLRGPWPAARFDAVTVVGTPDRESWAEIRLWPGAFVAGES